MSDWIKILISALAGVATGVLLEPLKYAVSLAVNARFARRAIYRELGKSYLIFCIVEPRRPAPDETYTRFMVANLSMDAFDYYYSQKRDSFYKIREWNNLIGLYRRLRNIQKDMNEGRLTATQAAYDIAEAINDRIKSQTLDFKWIKQFAEEYATAVAPFVISEPQKKGN
jgi:hypothetical protein